MFTNNVVLAYLIYLPITLGLTTLVARILFRHGRIFLQDIFNKRETIVNATNNLFKVGFYLLNVGFALLILKIYANQTYFNAQRMIEVLSTKVGGFSIYLGISVFAMLFLFFRGKRIAAKRRHTSPTANPQVQMK
jgi:small basic protein